MNIALVGAPGSGKSELAEQIAGELDDHWIVDNYVAAIEKETDIHVGSIIDYVGNMMVILKRYGLENKARSQYKNVVTCGTIFESSIYYTAHVLAFKEASTEQEALEYAPRVEASLRMMACFYNDLMPYDHIFYLRLGAGTPDAQFLDQQLQTATAGFKLRNMVPLDVGDNRLEKVLSEIQGA